MAIKIAHSAIDENGRATNGVAGDQNGKEVCIATWYNKSWGYVIRFKDREMANRFAKAMEDAAKNNKIGYDQNGRNTVLIEAEKVGWDLSRITVPCESDCSSIVTVCAISAGVPKNALFNGNCCTTRTLRSKLQATGLVDVFSDAAHVGSDKNALRGDIYLKEGNHVIVCIEDGAAAAAPKPAPAPVVTKPATSAPSATAAFKEGDVIKLKPGATYANGKAIPSWVFNKTLYYRRTNEQGIVFSTLKTGAVTGVVKPEMIIGNTTPTPAVKTFKVQITADALYIRKGPGTTYGAVGTVKKPSQYVIVEEKNGWGRLEDGRGWISLNVKYSKRI